MGIIIYVIIFILLITGLRIEKNDIQSSDMYQRQWLCTINNYRGLAAILIIVGHVVNTGCSYTSLMPITRFAYVIVGYFFFVSGVGIAKGYKEKKMYLKNFLRSKVAYLLIISIISYLFYLCVDQIFQLNAFNRVTNNILLNYIVDTNWYIWELLGFYIAFYLIFRLWGGKGQWWLLGLSVVFVFTIYFLNGPSVYYKSALCFPIGIILGNNIDRMALNRKTYMFLLKIFLVATSFGVIFLIMGIPVLRQVAMSNIVCFDAVMILSVISLFICYESHIISFLNKYSAYLYTSQFVWLKLGKQQIESFPMRLCFVLAATIVSAIILTYITDPIKKILKKEGK